MTQTACPTERTAKALELRSIRACLKDGMTPEQIALDRDISLRTCRRRIRELARLEAMLSAPRRPAG